MTLYHLTPARARRLLARADDHRVVNKDEERRPPTVVSVDAFSRGAAGGRGPQRLCVMRRRCGVPAGVSLGLSALVGGNGAGGGDPRR